ALSRLYVGVHYPTDVVAAVVISSSAVLFYCGLWNRSLSGVVSRMSFLEVFGPLPPNRPGENQLPQRNG
ncbi:MAG: phosphatase PAP2 family protein, partial [Micrococcaceae bacterium]|nr:phosphatase PAP2 family protein [Micrococcaceae bacterium]